MATSQMRVRLATPASRQSFVIRSETVEFGRFQEFENETCFLVSLVLDVTTHPAGEIAGHSQSEADASNEQGLVPLVYESLEKPRLHFGRHSVTVVDHRYLNSVD